MSRYPACSEPDVAKVLRGLNLIMKAAAETGTGKQAVISASIRFLALRGGLDLDMWRADSDPTKVLEHTVENVMRAAARVALSHEFPVPLIKRHVEPLRKLLDLGDDEDEDVLEPVPPRPPRSPAPPRLQ